MIQEIYDYVKTLPLIDTHEHLPGFEKNHHYVDVLADFLPHYYSVDMISAGLSKEDYRRVMGNDLSVKEKWALVEPYWQACRYTGYGQSLAITARDIYGVEEICGDTIEALNDAYLKLNRQEGLYHKILKEKCNIKASVLDCRDFVPVDREFFVPAYRINSLIQPQTLTQMEALEKETGVTICGFEDYLRACEVRIDQFSKQSPILKCMMAASRSNSFPRTTRAEAEKAYNSLFYSGSGYATRTEDIMFSLNPTLTNYLFRHVVSLAQEKGMVMQIHTGMQEGNGNILEHSKPTHLNDIFHEYPKMRFDVFHIGYPYQAELGALVKMYPNVCVDMCWTHILSPVAARRTLNEWLELFSYTKICGFGGDYLMVDTVYGHQYMARRNIAQALSEKVEEGVFSIDDACRIAKALLYDNPARIFNIQ